MKLCPPIFYGIAHFQHAALHHFFYTGRGLCGQIWKARLPCGMHTFHSLQYQLVNIYKNDIHFKHYHKERAKFLITLIYLFAPLSFKMSTHIILTPLKLSTTCLLYSILSFKNKIYIVSTWNFVQLLWVKSQHVLWKGCLNCV